MSIFNTLQLILCLLPTLLLGVPLTGAKKANPLDGRIIGGIEATIQQFPHQVSLQRYGYHVCGAVVIHNQVLLTAAHCINYQDPDMFMVRAGSTEIYQGGELIRIRNIITHEAYNSPTKLSNDIALLILERPLTFSRYIRSIPLVTKKDELLQGSNLYVSGWGSTSPNAFEVSQRLRYTVVHEIDHARCSAAYSQSTAKVTSTMMCAGQDQGGRDSCQGDSGGPLITPMNGEMKLIGIVSWGISCATATYPGVYTRVADFEDWIREQMSNAGGFQL